MTTRVTFYLLDAADPAARLPFACRLAEKAWKLGHRIHAHAAGDSEASRLDDLLWTFRQGSFVPHEIVVPGTTPAAPVTIGVHASLAPLADVLINLADDVPDGFDRYARVAEIVDASEASRQAGRERHRRYREAGITPETHEVAATAGAG